MATVPEEGLRNRWIFTKEQLQNSPSRADGISQEKELSYRQQAASLIQDMGPKLNVKPLCISTAIVYMHRFYMIHSFKQFDLHVLATSAIFLAAKVEEQPRRLHYVGGVLYSFKHPGQPTPDPQSEAFTRLIDDITYYEMMLLQTLGFDLQVEHPHLHVVRCMDLIRVSKDLSQTAYFLAHNSQMLTMFCLEHKPTVIACICIHLTCTWKGLEIPRSSDNRYWWEYVDESITLQRLQELTREFLTIVDKSPCRLKKRIMEMRASQEKSRHSDPLGKLNSSGAAVKHRDKQSGPVKHHPHLPSSTTTGSHHPKPHQASEGNSAQARHTPPPPPPPTSQPPQGNRPHPYLSNPHKPHKHKGRHHPHQPVIPHGAAPQNGSGVTASPIITETRGQKHALLDGSPQAPKHKRLKGEEVQQPTATAKQHLSLKDYQAKRQQRVEDYARGRKNAELLTEPITPSNTNSVLLPSLGSSHQMPYSSLSSGSSLKPLTTLLPPKFSNSVDKVASPPPPPPSKSRETFSSSPPPPPPDM